MKKMSILVCLFSYCLAVSAQVDNNQWTWMHGDDFIPQRPIYGIKGLSASTNKIGARFNAVSWTDSSGQLWVFGGSGNSNTGLTHLNDLWKYDPSTGLWTWINGDSSVNQTGVYGIKGTTAATNKPGGRLGSVSWTDTSGNLWLFGGRNFSSGNFSYFNDLWKYHVSSGQWTWMSGDSSTNQIGNYGTRAFSSPANKPGGRIDAVGWIDTSGNLLLFGGFGYSNHTLGVLNDLWKYTPSTGEWTWITGDNSGNQFGVYGTAGKASSSNKPGGRSGSVSWKDKSGNLWLFGGPGHGAGSTGYLNDLWMYAPSTGQWTWISGDSTGDQKSVYGTRRVAAPANKPGGRNGAFSWIDDSGNLWLYGGSGYATDQFGNLKDLWRYVPQTGLWTWINGDSTLDKTAVYGTKGKADSANDPGGRFDAVGGMDASGNIWLLTGNGYAPGNSNPYYQALNDLWKFVPSTEQWTWMSGDNTVGHIGVYGTKNVDAPANKPGGRQYAVSWTDSANNLWLFGGSGYNTGTISNLNDLWRYNTASGQWSWMSGDSTGNAASIYGTRNVPDPANKPGARSYAVGWKDISGNFWLFGGTAGFELNDFWKYVPSTGLWTWMSGDNIPGQPGVYGTKGTADPANKPGARFGAISWTDPSGNLWLFGGYSLVYVSPRITIATWYNDLWMFTPSTNQWAWMSGDNFGNSFGVYGIKGIDAPANKPGARQKSVSWTDASGNLWLFGGYGFPGRTGSRNYLNDLWKYSPATGHWTWVGGDSTASQTGVYGTKGLAAPANKPGARMGTVSWTDSNGDLLLFGGSGAGSIVGESFSDLWRYTPSSGLWTWAGGDSILRQTGVYGTKGIAGPSNKPGTRNNATGWADASANLWLFGGFSYTPRYSDYLNDLWKYSITGTALPVRFSRFTVKKQMQAVLLNWSTAEEQNTRCFIIERSPTGTLYDSIGTVAASGTVSTTSNYSFTDMSPLQGDNFYRLKELDLNGKFQYSTVERIHISDDANYFTLTQNPVQNRLKIGVRLSSSRKLRLQVRDINGHLLLREERLGNKGNTVYSIPVGHLAKGVYWINLQSVNLNGTKLFIKQ